MQVNLKLFHATTGNTIKSSTIKAPDRSSRTSLVILAKKWAALSGVPSTTTTVDINTHQVYVPTALHFIEIEVDRLDTKYADQMVMHENKSYIWYEREHAETPHVSYGMKDKRETLKGVWK